MPLIEQEFIFIRLTVLREYLERELSMTGLPFTQDFEVGFILSVLCDVSKVCGENENEGDEVGEEGQDEEGLRGIVFRVEVFTTCCESQAVASTCSMK